MEHMSKEEKNELVIGFKIALRTLACCFIVSMITLCSIFVLFPKTSLKINEEFGFVKVQEYNYQLIYDRSGKITDLYNLVLFEEKQKNTAKELVYIDKMLARTDYSAFCKSMDKASLESVKNKNLIPYSSNINGYLLSRKVICLYAKKTESFDGYLYEQTKNGDICEYSFSTYVDLVFADESLTTEQKKEKFDSLMLISKADGESMVSLETLVENRVNALNNRLSVETDDNQKIILNYTLMRIYASRYYVYSTQGNETLKQENSELYKQAKTNLNNLINA